MFSVSCIKCGKVYESKDEDPYYCESCNKERLMIAAEVDKKLANRPRKQVMSALQAYDSDPNKVHGFIRVKL